jgi:trehalose 6-phosphate synthase
MSRLVTVSNRVALPRGADAAGGLAIGVLAAMRTSGGLWFGWSGRTCAARNPPPPPELVRRGNLSFATIDIPEALYELYYSGFANGTLWPLLHYFLDSFRYQDEQYEAYLAVNALFTRELLPLLRADDLIWVHDYHLIPLAAQLRDQGVRSPIGFFLHVPFPHFEVFRALPVHRELLRALLAYDLVGFQTEVDRQAFLGAVRAVCGEACMNPGHTVHLVDRVVRTGVFPIGIDPEAVAQSALRSTASGRVRNMIQGLLHRQLIIGVDRLDYSKGLLERFEAYQHFLAESPQHRGRVTYVQIAPLGRQNVAAYGRIRDSLEQSAGRINGRFGDVDWTPIRYLNRNFPHATLMAFLRLAKVCLVTPLRDGMNLVAKEFIGAQDPADPGVLVLSDRAGAARELTDALLVNPFDTRGMARAIRQALDMPLSERCARHERLLEALRENDIYAWCSRFVAVLEAAGGRAVHTAGADSPHASEARREAAPGSRTISTRA